MCFTGLEFAKEWMSAGFVWDTFDLLVFPSSHLSESFYFSLWCVTPLSQGPDLHVQPLLKSAAPLAESRLPLSTCIYVRDQPYTLGMQDPHYSFHVFLWRSRIRRRGFLTFEPLAHHTCLGGPSFGLGIFFANCMASQILSIQSFQQHLQGKVATDRAWLWTSSLINLLWMLLQCCCLETFLSSKVFVQTVQLKESLYIFLY